MANEYFEGLERNVYGAIKALESERYFWFTEGLLALLNQAKHDHRMLWSVLEPVAGVPRAEVEARLKRAKAENTW